MKKCIVVCMLVFIQCCSTNGNAQPTRVIEQYTDTAYMCGASYDDSNLISEIVFDVNGREIRSSTIPRSRIASGMPFARHSRTFSFTDFAIYLFPDPEYYHEQTRAAEEFAVMELTTEGRTDYLVDYFRADSMRGSVLYRTLDDDWFCSVGAVTVPMALPTGYFPLACGIEGGLTILANKQALPTELIINPGSASESLRVDITQWEIRKIHSAVFFDERLFAIVETQGEFEGRRVTGFPTHSIMVVALDGNVKIVPLAGLLGDESLADAISYAEFIRIGDDDFELLIADSVLTLSAKSFEVVSHRQVCGDEVRYCAGFNEFSDSVLECRQ